MTLQNNPLITNDLLKDFCKENQKPEDFTIEDKQVIGYDTKSWHNGIIRISLKDHNDQYYFIHTNIIELLAFIYSKLKK